MEDIPPSYFQSMNPSVLDLIAPYLDTWSLHALTLVSRSYNETFMPHLWGSPASHFVPMAGPTLPGDPDNPQASGSHDDMVYVALTRFKRTLKKARLSTRFLVHTLFLPPALSEIYGGPNTTWLKEILDGLPNLQSLCVGGLPFFDHHSLVAVDRQRTASAEDGYQQYPLKLLLASKEPNTTSMGLSLFLPRVPDLIYLDLSYTTPARDSNVMSVLSRLRDLQVLKLRGIGLRDIEAEVLANAIGLRVRLLDVAENLLSDMAVRSLLQACFQHTKDENSDGTGRPSYPTYTRRHLESWPVSLPPAPDFLSLDTLRSSDLDKNLRIQLTNPLTGRLAFEDIPHAGLTHLYITGNPAVTIEGIKSLLATGRLHVLDAGEVAGETMVDKYVRAAIDTGRWQDHHRSFHSPSGSIDSGLPVPKPETSDDRDIQFPGAEKLIPTLNEKASHNLTYLRIDHAVITKGLKPTAQDTRKGSGEAIRPTSPVELSAQIGVTQLVEAPGSKRQPVEIAANEVYELDATPVVRAELPGDLIHFALTPPIGEKPQEPEREDISPKVVRGEGPYAPEVILKQETDEDVVLDAIGFGQRRPTSSQALMSPVSPMSPTFNHFPTHSTDSTNPQSIDSILNSGSSPVSASRSQSPQQDKQSEPGPAQSEPATPPVPDRRARIDSLLRSRPQLERGKLYPSSLPYLRTLILTNVPNRVPADSPILSSLKQFISLCALEAQLSLLRAKTDYSLPPGRARFEAEHEHARSLFALRTIALEVTPIDDTTSNQRDWKHTRQRLNISKSSTGDHDSEALWSAAENDFSFFGEEGEEQDECGIYDHEPGKYFPKITLDDKFAVVSEEAPTSGPSSPRSSSDNTNWRNNQPNSSGTIFQSPRQLPLGRNRRSSNDSQRGPSTPNQNQSVTINGRLGITEMPGTIPSSNSSSPRPDLNLTHSRPAEPVEATVPMVDVVGELSKFRKERKAAYEAEKYKQRFVRVNGVSVPIGQPPSALDRVASASDMEVFVEGHWKGEIKVIRTHGASTVANGDRTGIMHNNQIGGGALRGSNGRLRRTGMVDVYGNYFEKGYLYS